MARRKASTEATDTAPSVAASAPLPIETPKIETSAEPARIEMPQVEPMAELLKVESFKARIKDDEAAVEAADQVLEAQPPAWRRHAPLAASVALAAVLGALAGAAATSAFSKPTPSPTTKAATTIADETRALKESVVRLSTELATVKAGADVAHRNTAAQLNKLADRFDRAEKAQAEPAARLAKIAESLDRIERRPATAAASDVTGSVTVVEKQDGKPPVIDGWKLLEFYAGRAVVENRSGGLFEIGPGSSLPGLGKVESIKRQDGRVVITTPKGVIVSAFEQPRRPPHYLPRY